MIEGGEVTSLAIYFIDLVFSLLSQYTNISKICPVDFRRHLFNVVINLYNKYC